MVAIGLSTAAVARIRFGISGLWEVAASARVLRDPRQHAIHQPWVARVRQRLTEADLVGPAAGLLWHLVTPAPEYIADFLTPPPRGLTLDLEAELAAMCATPPDSVRADLRAYGSRCSGALRDLYDNPAAGLRQLADEIRSYWAIALAPFWGTVRAGLEADVFGRIRRMAEAGAEAVLGDLHQNVLWDDGTLSVANPTCTAADIARGASLVLIPSAFVWPSVLSIAGSVSQLAYPVQGVGNLWAGSPTASDGLRGVVGRGRAQLLIELAAPLSTNELAQRVGMSAGGVSQHLSALRAAGLVTTRRNGRRLINMRTRVADALLSGPSVSTSEQSAG